MSPPAKPVAAQSKSVADAVAGAPLRVAGAAFVSGLAVLLLALGGWAFVDRQDSTLPLAGLLAFLGGLTVGFAWLLLDRLMRGEVPSVESH
jgi:hypothetical protein